MLERQREGIAKAKAEGKYKGRKPTARARAAEVKALKADGVRPPASLALAGRASIASWIADRVNRARYQRHTEASKSQK
jgi:DNA invertase Pin-like site-specific DNA recombinase